MLLSAHSGTEYRTAILGANTHIRQTHHHGCADAEMIDLSKILCSKILIVDDQKANVLLLEEVLKNAGYLAVSASTRPTEVCVMHLEHRYDLIIMDLQMPGMDGFAVMEKLKEIAPDPYLPVLVLTAQPAHK